MKKIFYKEGFLMLLLWSLHGQVFAQTGARTTASFNQGWKFYLGDIKEAIDEKFDDSGWHRLALPHDWSIELPFDKNSPAGTGGGALPGGMGWYRKTFLTTVSMKNKYVFIDFDGIYMNSEVWINGHSLGVRPNGYISFRYELTPYLKKAGEKNVIVVKVDNSKQPNSRWYSGSGIYRNVWMVTTNDVFVSQWGTYISPVRVNNQSSEVVVKTFFNSRRKGNTRVILKTILLDASSKPVHSQSTFINVSENGTKDTAQTFTIANPHLWDINDPYLYKALTQLYVEGKLMDEYTTVFGIRYFNFDVDKGFSLNGKPVKIIGVCDHHDLGSLGTAINTRALERQLEILKAMGCNGIRTSHNPPAPELLDLCDRLGLIVMDEAFDMWKKQKNPYDYHLYWGNWHKKDLEDQVLRDRNHPSVFIWSIGNEIPEQWAGKDGKDSSGVLIAKELAGIIKSLDTTRPITSAMDNPYPNNSIYRSGALDLIGFNYHHKDYKTFPQKFPGKKFIATETVSALQTRGHYDMPSDSIRRWPARWDKPIENANADLTCSAYDNCATPWGSTHEETLKELLKYDFASGMFIWTGFDYIGEPTPYPWPARSSYFGIIDLAGFPKDVYYLYQSLFTDKKVLHLFPHWNWAQGQNIDVWAYYNQADEVELFLNGKSLGVKKKEGSDLHIAWRVAYEPGILKAVSRKGGKIVLSTTIKTAGTPARIALVTDRNILRADGRDLSFATVKIMDKDGNLIPNAENLVRFQISGNGVVAAVDNGSETSLETFRGNHRRAFNGMCLVIIQSTMKAGKIQLTATSDGLQNAVVTIQTR